MKRSITITIDCGETTCASEPGEFCRFVGMQGFGSRYVCTFPFEGLRGDQDRPRLFDEGGWIQRCALCKETFK